MPTTTTTIGLPAGKGAVMAASYTPPRPGTIRWLSAAGHPGYSRESAAKVKAYMASLGEDLADLRLVSTYAFHVLYGYAGGE